MRLVEAFKYMKKIITNGVKKGYSVSAVKNSIDTYIDILVEEGNINSEDARVLKDTKKDLSSIMSKMSKGKTFDEALVDILRESEKQKVKKVHEVESPVIVSCGGSRVSRDRCGNVIAGRCGSPVYESSSSRCGGSSSSSCGSGSISRC